MRSNSQKLVPLLLRRNLGGGSQTPSSFVPGAISPSSVVRQVPPTAPPNLLPGQLESESQQKLRRRILNMSHPVDVSLEGIRSWANRNHWQEHVRRYSFNVEMIEGLGPELAAAYFLVARGGAVKFSTSDRWHALGGDSLGVTAKSEDQLMSIMPQTMMPGQAVEAVVLRGLPVVYESIVSLAGCSNLRYLDLSYCEHVDDWCLTRLHHNYHSLRYLDISGCRRVTDRGVSSLYQLHNLKRLIMRDLPQITDNTPFMVALETSLPNCLVTPSIALTSSNEELTGQQILEENK